MNTTFTALDDEILATIAAGTNGQTITGQTTTNFDPLPIFGPGPVLTERHGLIPFATQTGEADHRLPIGPCPNPDANG